jgi:hypothetical protein
LIHENRVMIAPEKVRTNRRFPEGPLQTRLVAVCDVLGFRGIVARTPLNYLAEQYGSLIKDIKGPLRNRWLQEKPSGREILHKHDVRLFIFSDTLLLWTGSMHAEDSFSNRAYNLERTFAFFRSVALLIGIGLRDGFPLRIGIAFGSAYTDRQSQRFLGQALIDAFDVEESQDWIGVACHGSCDANPAMRLLGSAPPVGPHVITLDDLLIRYEIPLKSQTKTRAWTVDWPPYSPEETRQMLEGALGRITDTDAMRKWKNTLDYFASRQAHWSLARL